MEEKLIEKAGGNNQQPVKDEENNYDINKSANPTAVLFTLVFKALAVASYFFLGILFSNTTKFIVITLLLCFDFWAVKNVTGRLLVGLKWGSRFKPDGETEWYYQSYDHEFKPNTVDKSFFWTSQTLASGFWTVFLFLNIIGLGVYDACLCGVGFILSGLNLYGYYNCSKEHQKKLKNMKNKMATEGLKYMAKKQFS